MKTRRGARDGLSETSSDISRRAGCLDAAGDAGGAEAARRRDAAVDRLEGHVRLERDVGHAGIASASRSASATVIGRSARRRVVVERVPWMIAAGSSGPMVTPGAQRQHHRMLTAAPEERAARAVVRDLLGHPDVRNDREAHAHEVRRLVRERAQRRESARGGRRRDLADEIRPDVTAAERLVDDQRAHFGDLAAERRQLGAADDGVVDGGDDEAR